MCINWVAGSKLLTLSGSSISTRDLRPFSENGLVKDSGFCLEYERTGLDLPELAAVSEAFSFVEGSWGGQTGCPSSIVALKQPNKQSLESAILVKRRLRLVMVKNP